MAAMTSQDAYDKIFFFIKQKGGAHQQWYCGIAANWEDRLFNEHQIPNRNYEWWITLECTNNIVARNVEEALHKLGCDGEPGVGDQSTVWVYAYLKGTMTNP